MLVRDVELISDPEVDTHAQGGPATETHDFWCVPPYELLGVFGLSSLLIVGRAEWYFTLNYRSGVAAIS